MNIKQIIITTVLVIGSTAGLSVTDASARIISKDSRTFDDGRGDRARDSQVTRRNRHGDSITKTSESSRDSKGDRFRRIDTVKTDRNGRPLSSRERTTRISANGVRTTETKIVKTRRHRG